MLTCKVLLLLTIISIAHFAIADESVNGEDPSINLIDIGQTLLPIILNMLIPSIGSVFSSPPQEKKSKKHSYHEANSNSHYHENQAESQHHHHHHHEKYTHKSHSEDYSE